MAMTSVMTIYKRNFILKKMSDIFCHPPEITFAFKVNAMKSKSNILLQAILFLLILLWVYAASSKLMDFNMFRAQMHMQVLPALIRTIMPYSLPPVEIAIALLLLFETTRKSGLYFSFALLLAFTIYVGLAVVRVYDNIPCSCGGVFNKVGWTAHFFINVFFLLLTATGIYINNRERRERQT